MYSEKRCIFSVDSVLDNSNQLCFTFRENDDTIGMYSVICTEKKTFANCIILTVFFFKKDPIISYWLEQHKQHLPPKNLLSLHFFSSSFFSFECSAFGKEKRKTFPTFSSSQVLCHKCILALKCPLKFVAVEHQKQMMMMLRWGHLEVFHRSLLNCWS